MKRKIAVGFMGACAVLALTGSTLSDKVHEPVSVGQVATISSEKFIGNGLVGVTDSSPVLQVDLLNDKKHILGKQYWVTLDTGAYTTMIPQEYDDQWHLPCDGYTYMKGVDMILHKVKKSHIYIRIGNITRRENCIVYKGFPNILLGADFFRDNKLTLTLNYNSKVVSISDKH